MTTHAKDGTKLSNKHKGVALSFENPVPDAHLVEFIQAIDSWGTRHDVRYSLALTDDASAEDCYWEIWRCRAEPCMKNSRIKYS